MNVTICFSSNTHESVGGQKAGPYQAQAGMAEVKIAQARSTPTK